MIDLITFLQFPLASLQMNIISGGFYDGLMLYTHALNETMTSPEDRPVGKTVTRRMWNRTYNGQSIPCTSVHNLDLYSIETGVRKVLGFFWNICEHVFSLALALCSVSGNYSGLRFVTETISKDLRENKMFHVAGLTQSSGL
jgi:hypothetical protein